MTTTTAPHAEQSAAMYQFPTPKGYRLVNFKELQSEANAMIAHIAKEPFSADQAAQNFSAALFKLTAPQSEKNADNASQLIGWAMWLSMAADEVTT